MDNIIRFNFILLLFAGMLAIIDIFVLSAPRPVEVVKPPENEVVLAPVVEPVDVNVYPCKKLTLGIIVIQAELPILDCLLTPQGFVYDELVLVLDYSRHVSTLNRFLIPDALRTAQTNVPLFKELLTRAREMLELPYMKF